MGVIWSGFLQQQRRGRWRRGAEGIEGGKGRKAGRRQELAPIAIVNPLLAHGDILGLESHKKNSEEIEIETMKRVEKTGCKYSEKRLCVTNSINIL